MNQEEKDIQLAEDYLEGRLSPTDIRQLETRLATDAPFSKLVGDLRILIPGIRYTAIKSNLQVLEASLPTITMEKKPRLIRFTPFQYAMAAAAVITLIIAAAWFFTYSNTGSQQLFAEYYTPYPNVINAVTRGENHTSGTLHRAFAAYDNQAFDTAAQLFEKALAEHPDPALVFYAGSAHLAHGNTHDAEIKFREVIKTSNEFSVQAQWYLSLCHLKQGKTGEAKKLLEELKKSNTSYREKAVELINKINS